jgi:hypothetical protein
VSQNDEAALTGRPATSTVIRIVPPESNDEVERLGCSPEFRAFLVWLADRCPPGPDRAKLYALAAVGEQENAEAA